MKRALFFYGLLQHAIFSSIPVSLLLFILTINLYAGIGVGESQEGPTPVELTSFSASVNGDVVVLNWKTATEVNNYGFEIQRSIVLVGTDEQPPEFETIGFVEGHGNSNSPKEYNFVDNDIALRGIVKYRLKQIDIDGHFEYSDILEINLSSSALTKFELSQNYPNPFNPTTVISYSLPETAQVTLKVFDALGKEVATLANQKQAEGNYKVYFNATDLSAGVYFYKINAGKFSSIKKMLLLK